MQREPCFSGAELARIAEILGGAATHPTLTRIIQDVGLNEPSSPALPSKRDRIFNLLAHTQNHTQTGNYTLLFIQRVLSPRLFTHDEAAHVNHLTQINKILAFRGRTLSANGKYDPVTPASTIEESKERAGRLHAELERRKVHPDVLKYCKAEYLKENYFHMVLEATKSVSDKIRSKTNLTSDGGQLAQQAFSLAAGSIPALAFNDLTTDSEKSEQKGLQNLFVGMFGTFRNTTAHAPKISWNLSEQDALDLLTLVSFLHRRLDAARRPP